MFYKKEKYLFDCQIIHKIKGRIRVKSDSLKYLGILKEEIEDQFSQVTYINSMKINSVSGTSLIYYDDAPSRDGHIVTLLQNTLNAYLVEIYKNEKKMNSNQYIIEKKLQEESPKALVTRLLTNTILLGYYLMKPSNITKIGLSNIFRIRTLPTLSLALPVIKNGFNSLIKYKRPNADTLSSTAIISSLVLGKETTALTIMILENVSELLTVYTMNKTRGAIRDMLSVGENYVWKEIDDEQVLKISIDEIKKGDNIIVQTGEKISVDGVIIRGEAIIDQSSITGEYMPLTKKVGEEVFAGTIVKSGSIAVEAVKIGDDRAVSRIIKLVEDANENKAQIQTYADTFSAKLIPLNFILSAIVYLTTRDIEKSISMLVIDYSCGIRLSTAAAFSASINNAAKNGILIKGSNFIEATESADTVIFDKTGTITEGKPKIQTVEVFGKNMTIKKMLSLAAAAEKTSNHPLATAILNEVDEKGLKIPKSSDTEVVVSKGIECTVSGARIRVGSKKFMQLNDISTNESQNIVKGILYRGEIIIYVARNEELIGVIGVSDPPRENIKKTINRLRNQGIDDIILLTGDLRQQAETVATRMTMDSYESELLPEDKAKNILKIQSKGSKVIMIGDGINDALALTYANVGIALGSSRTDVAMEAADITITKDNPLLVPGLISLSRQTIKTIKQNFNLSVGINTFALVLGATGILPTIYGSVIHNASTILVVANSLRLLKHDINGKNIDNT